MSDQVWHVRKQVPSYVSSEHRKYLLEMTRREVGYKIFEILWTNKLPAVIDLEENIRHEYSDRYPVERVDVIEYRVALALVKYRDVEIANMPSINFNFREPTLKDLLNKWKKNLVSRLSNWQSRLSS